MVSVFPGYYLSLAGEEKMEEYCSYFLSCSSFSPTFFLSSRFLPFPCISMEFEERKHSKDYTRVL